MVENKFEEAATEVILRGMAKASRLLAGTKLCLDDVLIDQIGLLCSEDPGGEKRAEEFCERLMASVRRSTATIGQQKMLELFDEFGVKAEHLH